MLSMLRVMPMRLCVGSNEIVLNEDGDAYKSVATQVEQAIGSSIPCLT
jgi:hypothetical protein